MGVHRQPLTTRQLAVLRWIANGCPAAIWPDETHKLSARVLETRNLASVRRRNGAWHAVLQPDGQYYLDHGTYPDEPRSTPTARPTRRQVARTDAPARPTSRQAPAPVVQSPAKPPSPVERLIADIQAAGGSLTLELATDQERARLDAQIRSIRRFKKLPPGTQLVVERQGWREQLLKIEPLPDWMTGTLACVPVPTQLRNLHPAVATLRDADGLLPVSGPPRTRALRLLQALATVATDHGHTVSAVTEHTSRSRRHERRPIHLRFHVHSHDIGLCVSQKSDRTDHVPTAKELAAQQRYSWTHIPKYDYAPSARLKFELPGPHEHQQSVWTDGVRYQLEDKLPEILQEIELRSDAAERARLQAEEQRRQEQIREQERIARATVKLIESSRAETLLAQLAAWQRTRQLDEYLAAMTVKIAQLDDPEAAKAASEWLTWAQAYAAGLNPLNGTLAMPPDPAPTYTALAPFLERPRGVYGW